MSGNRSFSFFFLFKEISFNYRILILKKCSVLLIAQSAGIV